jgi:hypothetical protein
VLSREGLVVDKADISVAHAIKEHDVTVGRSYDYFLSHLTKSGGKFKWKGRAGINQMMLFFNAALQGIVDESKPPLDLTAITLIRNPATRLRSHFDYYLKSTGKYKGTFGEWLEEDGDKSLRNFQSIEMGIYTQKDLKQFIAASLDKDVLKSGQFQFVMVMERMDECLVLLRRLLVRTGWEWDLLDLIHIDQPMSTNWKGGAVIKSSLSTAHAALSLERNNLDADLWNAASKRLDGMLAAEYARDNDNGRRFKVELETYKLLQTELKAQCKDVKPLGPFGHKYYKTDADKWNAGPAVEIPANLCLWYMMDDVTYVNFIAQHSGDVAKLFTPALEAKLMAVKEAVVKQRFDNV